MISRPRRWSPTPEQLMMLQELYRKGLRNPNSGQVRTITAHLSLYGKIEGKNVFYWFQNHKARDRQKLRKALLKQMHHRQFMFGGNQQQQQQPPPYCVGDLCRNSQPGPLDYNERSRLDYGFSQHNMLFSNPITTFLHKSGDEEVSDMENGMKMRMYGRDWMLMMMGMQPSFPYGDRITPKTLELFPLKATNSNIKDGESTRTESSSSNSS